MKKYIYTFMGVCFVLIVVLIMRSFIVNGSTDQIHYNDKVIVLMYHDIQTSLEAGGLNNYTVTVKQFREHLSMLKNKGFNVITMDMFIRFMLDGKPIPPNAIVITFDDGYESFYNSAFPVLQEFSVTASNFIVGISSDLFNPDAEPHLTWEQMRELKEKGMGIYNHTYNSHRIIQTDPEDNQGPALTSHLYLEQRKRQETEKDYLKRISTDILFMEKRLQQELGLQRKLLAFPFGAYNETIVEEGTNLGVELFFSTEEGMNAPGDRIVKRINAGEPYMTVEALWNHLKNIIEN